ncbi:MAG: hypothetical protein ACOC53_05055 [Candidatus Saliniplasma sp.]
MSLAETLANNFFIIFYSVVIILILTVIAKILNTREKEKTRRQISDLRLKSKKLDMLEKEKYIKELKDASMVLRDDEKSRLDEITRDKAILSRRSLALMNEIEERMQRLERGTDNAKLMKTLNEIQSVENELFSKKGEN